MGRINSYTELFVTRNMISPSASELEAVAALRIALRRFLTATDDVTADHGLTPRQYDLLALLHRPSEQKPPTPTAIAEDLCLSRSATTELLTRAATAGLVARAADADDARIKHVTPTNEGSKRFFAAVAELSTERERVFSLLRLVAGFAAAWAAVS